GGGGHVGVRLSRAESDPHVTGYIGKGATVNAGGHVTVKAEARSDASKKLGDDITAVSPGTDTITFPQHGLITGDLVVYTKASAPAAINTPAGNLAYGRAYPVLVTGGDTLQLGSTFDAGSGRDATNPPLPLH